MESCQRPPVTSGAFDGACIDTLREELPIPRFFRVRYSRPQLGEQRQQTDRCWPAPGGRWGTL